VRQRGGGRFQGEMAPPIASQAGLVRQTRNPINKTKRMLPLVGWPGGASASGITPGSGKGVGMVEIRFRFALWPALPLDFLARKEGAAKNSLSEKEKKRVRDRFGEENGTLTKNKKPLGGRLPAGGDRDDALGGDHPRGCGPGGGPAIFAAETKKKNSRREKGGKGGGKGLSSVSRCFGKP